MFRNLLLSANLLFLVLVSAQLQPNIFESYYLDRTNSTAGYHDAVADDYGSIYYAPYAHEYSYYGEFVKYNSSLPYDDSSAYEYYKSSLHSEYVGYSAVVNCSNWIYYVPYAKGSTESPEYHCNAVRYNINKSFKDPEAWEWYDCSNSSGYESIGYGGAIVSPDQKYIYYVPADQYSAIVLQYNVSKPFNDSSAWTAANCSYVNN